MQAAKPGSQIVLEPDSQGDGIREWLAKCPATSTSAAAFDTRVDMPKLVTGAASRRIAKGLRRHGFHMIARPESFRVSKGNILLPTETERARRWAQTLAATSKDALL